MTSLYRTKDELQRSLSRDKKDLKKYENAYAELRNGGKIQNLTKVGARSIIKGLKQVIRNKEQLLSKWKRI